MHVSRTFLWSLWSWPQKARDVTRDSTFMLWINANDCACEIVSPYRSALQSNNSVVVTHAYYNRFQLPTGGSTKVTKVTSKLLTFLSNHPLTYLIWPSKSKTTSTTWKVEGLKSGFVCHQWTIDYSFFSVLTPFLSLEWDIKPRPLASFLTFFIYWYFEYIFFFWIFSIFHSV